MAQQGVPPGWPADLPPPGSREFAARVTPWLLDRCAPEMRGAPTIRSNPAALALVALLHCEAVVAGQREAYRSVRRRLAESLPPEAVEGVLRDLEAVGHDLVGTLREVTLVTDALAGTVWRPKL